MPGEPPQDQPAAPELSKSERAHVAAILEMYRQGWFPMLDEHLDRVQWVQPVRRGLIPLQPDLFRVSRSLRARVRSGAFDIRTDTAFGAVIRACAAPAPGRESTWLAPEIIDAFDLLHRAGHAHSIEAYHAGQLVGGLYGLALGSIFCGESMFSRPDLGGTDASKVCLVHLVHHLRRQGFGLLDSQLTNDHLDQFGCYDIPHEEYVSHLDVHAGDDRPWHPFEPARTIADMTRSPG